MKNILFSSLKLASITKKTFLMKVRYNDIYVISTNENVDYYKIDDNFILNANETKSIQLKKNQIVKVQVKGLNKNELNIKILPKNNISFLPYDPIKVVNAKKLLKDIDNHENDIFGPAFISYKKRNDGIYVNDNNPEIVTLEDLNKALTRQVIENKEVFFTFEHNNGIKKPFYYGYQIRNISNKPVFVTIRNVGYHTKGKGCWLGEKEWIDFYNTKFEIKHMDSWNESQMKNYEAMYAFDQNYPVMNYQPVTYILPPKKHIYVMGGTTKDSYLNANVFDSADVVVDGNVSGCANGACLFDVFGKVEASFFIYDNPSRVTSRNKTHQGYVTFKKDGKQYGRQYIGYDTCNGVVDANLTFKFNDLTPNEQLKVTFDNYYEDNIKEQDSPYKKINSTKHTQIKDTWVTHISPQSHNEGIGEDMTRYITIKHDDGKKIIIDKDIYDGHGYLANIGNWMVDYLDNYTLVNYGNKDRVIRIEIDCSGSLAIMVRDELGNVIKGSEQYTISQAKNDFGDAIRDNFVYEVLVKAKSVKQFSVEYNLLANSCGYVPHRVKLVK